MIARVTVSARCALLAAFVLAALAVGSPAQPQPRSAPREFVSGTNYRGVANRATFDSTGRGWLATSRTLYELTGIGLREVADAGSTKERLLLAPGGRVYAWLDYARAGHGFFTARVVDMARAHGTGVALTRVSRGFSSLHLGDQGKIIVSVSPLGDPLSDHDEFRYDFWNTDGQSVDHVVLRGRRILVLAVDGTSVAMLGARDAVAYDNAGVQLWSVRGYFRDAALAGRGQIALLNPEAKGQVDEVHVYRNGKFTTVKMRSPVHGLALTSDGQRGAIAVDEGGVFVITPATCDGTRCQTSELPALQTGGSFFVSELGFIDSRTLAIATIDRAGTQRPFTYPSAALHSVAVGSRSRSSFPVTLTQPAPGMPLLGVTYGVRKVAVHTPHRTYFLESVPP